MKIYIAGPMTGLIDCNRASFNFAAKYLESLGHTVKNPARQPDGLPYSEYIERGLMDLRECEAVVYLPGSGRSNGVVNYEQPEAVNHAILDRTDLIEPIRAELERLYSEAIKLGGVA